MLNSDEVSKGDFAIRCPYYFFRCYKILQKSSISSIDLFFFIIAELGYFESFFMQRGLKYVKKAVHRYDIADESTKNCVA